MARSGPDALSWCPTAPRRDPASAGAQAAAAAALRGGVEAAGWPAGGQGVVRHPAADDECDERRHRRHQGYRRQRRRGRQRHPLTWRCPAPSWLAASTVLVCFAALPFPHCFCHTPLPASLAAGFLALRFLCFFPPMCRLSILSSLACGHILPQINSKSTALQCGEWQATGAVKDADAGSDRADGVSKLWCACAWEHTAGGVSFPPALPASKLKVPLCRLHMAPGQCSTSRGLNWRMAWRLRTAALAARIR